MTLSFTFTRKMYVDILGLVHPNSHTRYSAYPVLLADSARVLEVASPGEAEGTALEVSVGEHVGQAERVVVLLCNGGC